MESAQVKDTMTAQEVADYLGVKRATIYKWSKYGDLPNRQVNERVRLYNRTQVDEWVKNENNKEGES
ncbi:helix-turn-helix domain-containing protein [Listeria rocourtiae]|uniref:helix-turn-helix transcriptional regulator n=1 Tax=Listeria rocourtiae TaxID=647910 RepID=UPI00162707F5|nr:helix-turn-helix domain-containing protein [Listeria rocourtiae]MBC1605695.1 helix-turn-helix domain-containing protein [Listeria rocourtiae]